jgi:diguanylate cyclase (GGDEF)-like protein
VDQLRLFADRRPLRVLIVEDDAVIAGSLRRRLRRVGRTYEVSCFTVAELMAGLIGEITADAVLVGVTADPNTVSALRRLCLAADQAAVIAVQHGEGNDHDLEVVITGAQDVITLSETSALRLDRVIRGAMVRRATENAVLADALTDPVTGMPARAWMLQRLDLAVAHAESGTDGWQVALLFCDLDRFKNINDSFGHAKGDEVLRSVADRLRSVVRAEDPLVRFGGDEFVVLLEGAHIEALAQRIALRALAALAEPFEIDGHAVSVFASIGLSLLGVDETAQDLLNHADLALYRAKRRGRNRVEIFDAELRAWSDQQHDLAEMLREDLRAGALELTRSTLWDLTSGVIVGSVAAPRWPLTDSPDELVDLAVRNGLGPELGRWMTRSAIDAASTDSHASDGSGASQIVVEIPPGLVSQPAFVGWIDEVLTVSHTDPARLVLALGESELGDLELVGPVLEGLDALGVSVALSEFGSAQASLTLFGSLAVDEVFLTADLVAGIATDPTRRAVVEGLLKIAGAIGQRVVATGPQTLADVAALVALGCEAVVTDLNAGQVLVEPTVDLPAFATPYLVPVR